MSKEFSDSFVFFMMMVSCKVEPCLPVYIIRNDAVTNCINEVISEL